MRQWMSAIAVAAVFAGLTAVNAAAQVRPGLSELNLSADISAMSPEEGDSETTMNVQLRYGYFLTPAIQLGAQLSAIKFEDVDTFGDVGVFGAYHFGAPGAMAVPYAGAHVGTGFGFDDSNPFSFGAMAGLKYFLGQAGAITPELYVTRSSADDFNWTTFGLRVGVSVFFGGN
ncbi:MAG TPA: hypothetical protein VK929_04355 [Longimicrobiales bacterium]|nr:hypothetical protein [Longimicrobiales bacterium]